MKKQIILFSSALLIAVTFFVACQKATPDVAKTHSLSERIGHDVAFAKTIESATNLYTSTSGGSLNNSASIAELQIIIAKVNNKTATSGDYARAESILGLPYDEFIKKLQDFGISLNDLSKKFPELSKMNKTDMQNTFTEAIKLNPELQNSLGNSVAINGRITACPLRDICNLAVQLTNIFGGSAICAAINVTTIPVIGGLLCTLILNIGVSILTGICNALPC